MKLGAQMSLTQLNDHWREGFAEPLAEHLTRFASAKSQRRHTPESIS